MPYIIHTRGCGGGGDRSSINSRSSAINPALREFYSGYSSRRAKSFHLAGVVRDADGARAMKGVKLWFVRTRCRRRNGYYPFAISEIIKPLRKVGATKDALGVSKPPRFSQGTKFPLDRRRGEGGRG